MIYMDCSLLSHSSDLPPLFSKSLTLPITEALSSDFGLKVRTKRTVLGQKKNSTTALHNPNLKIEVVVTNLRVRSGVSAIMLGFLAGADSITGQVYIKDGEKVLDSFEVDISYAFGGAMGDTDTRMNWMYESFSNKILEELKKLMPKT